MRWSVISVLDIVARVAPPDRGLEMRKGGRDAALPEFDRDEIGKLFE